MGRLKKNYTILILLLCMVPLHFQALAQNTSSLIQEAQQLYEQNREKESLDRYKEVLERQPNNFQATWRASFLYSRVGNRLDDEEKKENYYFNAMQLAEKAIELDSTNVNSHYALSVAVGRRAQMSNAKQRVAFSRKIVEVSDRGLKIDPNHPGLLHVKGFLYYKIATASTLETAAANYLFGGFPEDVTLAKSIDLLERAVDNRPDYLLYRLDLANAYIANGQTDKAKTLLNSILEKPAQTPDGNNIKQQARELLADL